MERIVFLDRKTCRAPLRSPRFLHQWQEHDVTARNEVAQRLQDATIAITNKVPLREPELQNLRALRYIAVAATGTDIIDLDYCRANNILVSNIPSYTQNSVPEHVFMLILALRRNLLSYRSALQRQEWSASPIFSLLDYPIHDIAGSTLGIIGYGRLGQAVEKLGRAFGMEVLVAERKHASEIRPGRTEFTETVGRSDVLTLHCPITPETRLLIGSTELSKMKASALLINTARGGLVDELALASHLQMKLLGGAGIDVLREEPPPADHPLMAMNLSNLIITPHIGWASNEAVARLADQLITNIESFLAGIPKNIVT